MSTLIRVKRRHDQDPTDLLLVNCKRRKGLDGQSSNSDSEHMLFNFAHTTTKKTEDFSKELNNESLNGKYSKAELCLQRVKEKIRLEFEEQQKENRYKVVNKSRTNGDVTLYDLEVNEDENDSIENEYVYDVYFTKSEEIEDIFEQDLIGVYPLDNDLIYGSYRDNGLAQLDDSEESDDSNAENNWRNDYPDEGNYDDNDDSSITNEDMIRAVKDGDLELSSDEEACREGFIYSIDSEAAGFEEDIDDSDVNRYGEMYARFKAMSSNTSNYNHDYSDEED